MMALCLPWIGLLAVAVAVAVALPTAQRQNLADPNVANLLITKYLAQYNFDQQSSDTPSFFFQGIQLNGTMTGSEKSDYLKCLACRGIMELVHVAMTLNKTKAAIKTIGTAVCKGLRIEDAHVCQCIVSEYVDDEVIYVLNQLVTSPEMVCPIFLPHCGHRDVYPLFPWDLSLPNTPKPPVKEPDIPPKDAPKIRVLQLADFHVDYEYSEGSESDCSEPLCCRKRDNKGTIKAPAGKWGSVASCDLPSHSAEYILQHIQQHEKFDYVIFTGDVPPHNVWNQTREHQRLAYSNFTTLMSKYFNGKKIFPAVGNHESAPADSFGFHSDLIPEEFQVSWLYDTLYNDWKLLTQQSLDAVKKIGSYMIQLFPGLRLISLNTNYCRDTNFWDLLNQTDPDGTLQWLMDELQDAENAGDKVHIIGHNVPSECNLFYSWSHVYYKIINRYESTIAAQFYGHTHQDQFKLFYEDGNYNKRPTNVMFISPSMTTYAYQNSAYRIYTIDARPNGTWAVLDYETYFLDIDKANKNPDKDPEIELEYKFLETYNVTSLSPAALNGLLASMQKNKTLLNFYQKFFRTSAPHKCDDKCYRELLCQIMKAEAVDLHFCRVQIPK